MNEPEIPLVISFDPGMLDNLRTAAGSGPVLILTHINPDPDSLASGKALAVLLKHAWNVPSELVYSGLVARAENLTMLETLTPEWVQQEEISGLERFSAIALVDTQPGAGNNNLPENVIPHIVIDHHHPVRDGLGNVRYVDVRPDVGATASLLFEYLNAADITLDAGLATAMFYAVQTDTRGLSRGESRVDREAYFKLLELLDRGHLNRIIQAGLPRDYFRAFSKGLAAAKIFGRVVVSYVGAVHRPDFPAEMADLLIRLEDARAVLCMGHHNRTMYLSLRTKSKVLDAGLLIQQVIVAPGKAGGHGMMAGGQVPLDGKNPRTIVKDIQGRFLKVMGEAGGAESLLS